LTFCCGRNVTEMKRPGDVAEVYRKILRLKLNPVGVRLCKEPKELAEGETPSEKIAFCQMVRLASQGKRVVSCPKDRMGCFTAQMVFGFRAPDERDVEHHMKQFTDDRELARSIVETKPKLREGEIEGLLVGPLGSFEPNLVILVVDSAQALPLLEAYGASTGKDLSFRNGTSSAVCSYGAVVSYQTQQPNLSIPCVGAKRYGLFQDHELLFTLPREWASRLSEALIGFVEANRLHLPVMNGLLSPTKPITYLFDRDSAKG